MKNFIRIAILMLQGALLQAQVPQLINYQAVARNSQNVLLTNQNISVRFSVREVGSNGTVVYRETHAVTTNAFGLFSCELGGGSPLSGVFSAIDWASADHFLEIEIDPAGGNTYVSLSTSQLKSVPYSLFADRSGTSLHAETADVADSLAGFSPSQIPQVYHWLIHDADSNTFVTAATSQNANNNTVQVTLNGNLHYTLFPLRMDVFHGGGNTLIGDNAGRLVDHNISGIFGDQNTFVGAQAGYSGERVNRNTYIGYRAGYLDTSGFANVFLGGLAGAGFRGGSSNVFVGYGTGQNMRGGNNNVLIGNTTTAYNMPTGNYNIILGSTAAYNATSHANVILGHNAASKVTGGGNNTLIGYNSNLLDSNFSNSTALGNEAIVQASNAMRFGNNSVTRWGFGTDVAANRALQVGSSSSNGNGAYLTIGGVWTNASDRNLKEDITEVHTASILEKVMQLSISRWKYSGTEEYHIGPMAQDFHALFNVGTDNVSISTIDPAGVSLAAIQELVIYIRALEQRIAELENRR